MSSETVSLLPCPFCGGAPEMQINGPTSIQAQHMISMGEDWDVTHFAACQCTATGPERREEQVAIAAWNDRALLPKATAPVVSEPVGYRYRERGMSLWSYASEAPAIDEWGLPDWEVEPLYASPQPQPKAVTEEMVERAWFDAQKWPTPISRSMVRRALEAALKED